MGASEEWRLDGELLQRLQRFFLPSNYDFELPRTAERICHLRVSRVALQMPEGLLRWGPQISAVLRMTISGLHEVTILADVAYGACCIDDITAEASGAMLLIHYGHSCLVPIFETKGSFSKTGADEGGGNKFHVHYVFIDILIDPLDLQKQIEQLVDPEARIALMGTLQFSKSLHAARRLLVKSGHFVVAPAIPQVLPLTAGEVLGCTAPKLAVRIAESSNVHCHEDATKTGGVKALMPCNSGEMAVEGEKRCGCLSSCAEIRSSAVVPAMQREGCSSGEVVASDGVDTVIFVADGRFHLEAAMIQNPGLRFLRYDPFIKRVFEEQYEIEQLHNTAHERVAKASSSRCVGILLSTLGRQGCIGLLEDIQKILDRKNIIYMTILMGEMAPNKLDKINSVDSFIQIGCPRLSVDWGSEYKKPLLNPYEAFCAFGGMPLLDVYPMDFYARTGGPWTNFNTSSGIRTGSLADGPSNTDRRSTLRMKLMERKAQRDSVVS